MYKVLIADDELIIRKGLCCIVDWNALGYEIIGEACNGEEALNFILQKKPDVVLIDIRMPKMHGLETIKKAKEQGFDGKVIILSGYSEFSYAQEAIRYGIQFYLTKPVDEDELEQILTDIKIQLDTDKKERDTNEEYLVKAKDTMLREFLLGSLSVNKLDVNTLNIASNIYQVIIYEKYSHNSLDIAYNFSDLLKVTNQNCNTYDLVTIDNNRVVLLKGNYAIEKLNDFLKKYDSERRPEKDSPLDSIFITCGRPVESIEEVPSSYNDAYQLLMRRFFCDQLQHTMVYSQMPVPAESNCRTNEEIINEYSQDFINHMQSFNRNMVAETLNKLKQELYSNSSSISIEAERMLLVDLYLIIKEKMDHLYNTMNIPFLANSDVINFIHQHYYLYEIVQFLSEQFEMIMTAIGSSSRDSIIDDIVHYINHNYPENITLENIAPLFGYNSSYLGKIFSKKMNLNFNTYLDQIRIQHSKDLLLNDSMKVYKIAELVGYRNVDYFHIKFKKHVGISPAEYRKQHLNK